MKTQNKTNRRAFISSATMISAGLFSPQVLAENQVARKFPEESLYLLGPMEGYSLHIGTLLSSMNMMRTWVVEGVKNLTTEQLDYQIDEQSNSIGAMLLHLAATERYYQLNTFDEMEWGSWSDEIKQEWDVPMGLGEEGRKQIKGHNIEFYLSKLKEVREVTKQEFAKRDDDWIMKSEPFFGGEPTNNYCKWFHVCEHESNHNGQIKFIKKRMPS
jgi:uncharacterized damage-inducible protein DinB